MPTYSCASVRSMSEMPARVKEPTPVPRESLQCEGHRKRNMVGTGNLPCNEAGVTRMLELPFY